MTREAEIAWAAGLFEGEGSIYADRKNGRLRIRFTLMMTDRDVVERFHLVIRCGSVSGPYWQTKSTKPAYSWKARRPEEIALLADELVPLLGQRRRDTFTRLSDEFAAQRPAIIGRPPGILPRFRRVHSDQLRIGG